MSRLQLTVGDTAPTLTGTVSANLTGATPVVHIRRPGAGGVISRTASVVAPATDGKWSLTLTNGDLTVSGYYYTEVEVTFSDGSTQTFRLDAAGLPTYFVVGDQIA
jgi:hypothetical protein